jgi:hypothetical protein
MRNGWVAEGFIDISDMFLVTGRGWILGQGLRGVRVGRPVGARWRSPVRGSARCPLKK